MWFASANALVAVISITALWGTVRAGEDRSSAGPHGSQLHRAGGPVAQAGFAHGTGCGRLDRLELLSPEGGALARGLWSGAATRTLSFTVCGQRRLVLRVTGTRASGPFQLTVTRP